MINLRYHIVSIVAIFLALAIGVAMGTSFLSKATVDQLKTQIRRAEVGIDRTNAENRRLQRDLQVLTERQKVLDQQGSRVLFRNQLSGVPVLLIASAGVDQSSLETLRTALESSSADFRGTLILTDKLKLEGDRPAEMAELLNIAPGDRRQVRRVLSARFAEMLREAGEVGPGAPGVSGSTGTTTTIAGAPLPGSTTTTTGSSGSNGTTTSVPAVESPQPSLMTALREGGWVVYQPPEGGRPDDPLLTTDGLRYVMVSGPDVAVPDSDFLLPVLQEMAASGSTPVVVASAAVGDDPERVRTVVVDPIRTDERLQKNVSTVDALEQFSGVASVVLAVDNLDNDVHGHYGFGDGATPLPPAP